MDRIDGQSSPHSRSSDDIYPIYGAKLTTGLWENALEFMHNEDYAEIYHSSSPDSCLKNINACQEGLSLAFWIRLPNNRTAGLTYILRSALIGGEGFAVYLMSSSIYVHLATQTHLWNVADAFRITPMVWFHVGVRWDTGCLRVYKMTEEIHVECNPSSGNFSGNHAALIIGSNGDGVGTHSDFIIDELFVFPHDRNVGDLEHQGKCLLGVVSLQFAGTANEFSWGCEFVVIRCEA